MSRPPEPPPLPLPNTYWVIPGRFLAGEYPATDTLAETQGRLEVLHSAGINYFLDLTEEDELPPYHYLLPASTKYLRHPIRDTEVPDDVAQMQEIQARVRAALMFHRSLYVHCRAGIGRTATVVGCFLVEQGLEGKPAVAELNELWQQSARSMSWPKVPQTAAQATYIQRWTAHRKVQERKA